MSVYSVLQNIEHDLQIYISLIYYITSKYKEIIKKIFFSVFEGRNSNNCTNVALNNLSLLKVEGGPQPLP